VTGVINDQRSTIVISDSRWADARGGIDVGIGDGPKQLEICPAGLFFDIL